MPYNPVFSEDFNETITKLKKKDVQMYERIKQKIHEIMENPHHYKPLSNVLKGCRRIHLGHFVLIFEINEREQKVIFTRFSHHDDAY